MIINSVWAWKIIVSNQSKQLPLNRRQFVFILQSCLLFAAFASITAVHVCCLLLCAVCCVLCVLCSRFYPSLCCWLAALESQQQAGRVRFLLLVGSQGRGWIVSWQKLKVRTVGFLDGYNPGRYIHYGSYDDRNIQNFKLLVSLLKPRVRSGGPPVDKWLPYLRLLTSGSRQIWICSKFPASLSQI